MKEMTESAEFKEFVLKGQDNELFAFSIHDVATSIPVRFCGKWGLAFLIFTSLTEQREP